MNYLRNRLYLRASQIGFIRENTLETEGVRFLSRIETLDRLINNRVSIARFGDGELSLLFLMNDLHFQRKSKVLSGILEQAISIEDPRLIVCINSDFMLKGEAEWILGHARSAKTCSERRTVIYKDDIGVVVQPANVYRAYFKLLRRITNRREWGEATVFWPGLYVDKYKEGNLEQVYEKIISIFENKAILVVGPKVPLMPPSFSELKIFLETFCKIDIFTIPARNCFDVYSQIKLNIIKQKSKYDLVMVQGGPVATALAYELTTEENMVVYDIGSLNVALGRYMNPIGRFKN